MFFEIKFTEDYFSPHGNLENADGDIERHMVSNGVNKGTYPGLRLTPGALSKRLTVQ